MASKRFRNQRNKRAEAEAILSDEPEDLSRRDDVPDYRMPEQYHADEAHEKRRRWLNEAEGESA